jgi:hypothetical protein
MTRRLAPRKSLKDQVKANAAWAAFASPTGTAPPLPASLEYLGKPKRVITHRSEKEELEGSVLKEVGEIILLSPNVVLAWRQNGGAAQASDGVFRIWFYRWIKRPIKEMVLVDFVGVLKDGHMFAIECKRRDWKYAATEREESQFNFLHEIIKSGGKAGFATSAEQALQILK